MEAIILIVWLLFGVACAVVLSNKGRSGCGGFALGFLLGPIGLIIALVMGTDHRELENKALGAGDMRKCPACAELIRVEARKCRFCGTEVEPLAEVTSSVSLPVDSRLPIDPNLLQ